MSLVDDLRLLTAAGNNEYTAGDNSYWSDSQLQAILNRHRALIDFQQIDWTPARIGGGSVAYTRGFIPTNLRLETTGGTVQDSTGGTVSGWSTTTDGYFTCPDAAGTAYFFTGWGYDINAAAAEVCTSWASALKGLVDVSTDDQSLKLSQKRTSLLDMAREFRRKGNLTQGALSRGDAN